MIDVTVRDRAGRDRPSSAPADWPEAPPGRARVCAVGVLTTAATVWAVTLVAVPYAISRDGVDRTTTVMAASAYLVGAVVCHQRPARSFHLWGIQMPVCARCAGLYAGAPFGAACGLAVRRRRRRRRPAWSVARLRSARVVLVVLAVPTALIWGGEQVGLAFPSNTTRAVAAVPLGFAVAWTVGLALTRTGRTLPDRTRTSASIG